MPTKVTQEVKYGALHAYHVMLSKIISRKFLVWIVATHMTYLGMLPAASWLTISLIYIGAQATLDWKQKQIVDTVVENLESPKKES
jgi:hypothetical protein